MNGIEVRMSGKGGAMLSVGEREVRGKGDGVGPAIAAAREMQGLSREQLAKRSGIPAGELERIEAGEKEVEPALLLKLAGGLKMKMELTFDMEPEATMGVKFKK